MRSPLILACQEEPIREHFWAGPCRQLVCLSDGGSSRPKPHPNWSDSPAGREGLATLSKQFPLDMLAATAQEEQGSLATNGKGALANPWESAKGGGYWSTEDIRKLVKALNTYGHGRWNEMLEDPAYGMKDAGRTPEGIEAKVRRLRKKNLIERISYDPEAWRLREDLLLATLKYNFDKMNPKMRGKLPPPPEIPPPLLPAEPVPKMRKRKRSTVLGGIFVNYNRKRPSGPPPAWTAEQVEWLLEGVNKFGVGNWSAIFAGDPRWRAPESGRRVDDLRTKFLQLKAHGNFVLQDSVWRLDPKAGPISEPASAVSKAGVAKVARREMEPVAARRILPGGKVRKQHVPWTEEEVLALVEGLNRYGEDGARDMVKDLTLAFNPKRRTCYIVKTKLDTLRRHEIVTRSDGDAGRWRVDLRLFHLITRRRKGLATPSMPKGGKVSPADEDDGM